MLHGLFTVTIRLEFYQRGSGILACYSIGAPSPGAPVLLGRTAVLEKHPSPRGPRRRSSLYERAECLSARDDSGWGLYRIIGKDDEPRSADAAPVLAT